jgi:hypothetical protein
MLNPPSVWVLVRVTTIAYDLIHDDDFLPVKAREWMNWCFKINCA